MLNRTPTGMSLKTEWLLACQHAIEDRSEFSVISTKQIFKRWDGKLDAFQKRLA